MTTETKTYGLPAYTSHKTVWGDKITKVLEYPSSDYGFILETKTGANIEVTAKWMTKHQPEDGSMVGGYFVVYKDNYNSWSPAEAFEEGNNPVGPEGQPNPEVDKITGYRHLSEEEIKLINKTKALANEVEAHIREIRTWMYADDRWVKIGTTHLQQGFMALVRAIAKPKGF